MANVFAVINHALNKPSYQSSTHTGGDVGERGPSQYGLKSCLSVQKYFLLFVHI